MSALAYSLCILQHGPVHYTEACLRSSLDLERSPRERIVVWNDSERSPDELPLALRRRVRIVDAGDNLGFTGGANLGIASALDGGADAVWLLNNDTTLEPASAAELLRVLEEHDDVAIVGPRIVQHGTSRLWNDGGRIDWPSARPVSFGFGEPDPGPGSPPPPLEVGFVCGCAPLIRGAAFRAVGGFDERYFIFYEDADLSLRALAAGWRLLHVPAARIHHHGSAVTGEGSPFSRYYRLRNRLLFSSEHAPDPEAARRARRRLRLKSRRQAWTRLLTGRFVEGRALLGALADASNARWGRRRSLTTAAPTTATATATDRRSRLAPTPRRDYNRAPMATSQTETSPVPDWQLRPLGVPELGTTIEIGQDAITFGRDPGNTHQLPEDRYPHVSAHHARVSRRDDSLMIEDLGSKNGTLVNGRRVERAELKNGDAIQLGDMGPRLAVVSSAGVGETVAMKPARGHGERDKRRLSATTIIQVKRALGIPEGAHVADLLKTRTRRQNLKLLTLVAGILAVGVLGVNFWFEYEEERGAELARLRRVKDRELDVLRDELAEARDNRLREEERELARAQQIDLLEGERDRLLTRIGQLEDAERSAAGNVEELKQLLQKTQEELSLFNPINLEQAKLREVERVARCVVLIERRSVFRNPESGKLIYLENEEIPNVDDQGEPLEREGTGSGFCVTQDGWIISNAHVVAPEGGDLPLIFDREAYVPETTIEVVFTGTSQRIPAVVQRTERENGNDVALLKIEPFDGMPHLAGLDVELEEPIDGSEVFLFGFPLGKFALQSGETVIASTFKGILSRKVGPFLQVDAGVYPGNSGGPITDGRGRVVAIVTAVQTTPEGPTAASIGYALPLKRLRGLWPPPDLDDRD